MTIKAKQDGTLSRNYPFKAEVAEEAPRVETLVSSALALRKEAHRMADLFGYAVEFQTNMFFARQRIKHARRLRNSLRLK